MQITQIEIKNYRSFHHAVFGNLPQMTVVVGANGSGKSTLFDVFSFLKDALSQNVATAVARRGGFRELVSRGKTGPIEIAIKFRESGGPLATYLLQVAEDQGRVVVDREILRYRRGSHGKPWHFVDFSKGAREMQLRMSRFMVRKEPSRRVRNTSLTTRAFWRSRAWVSSANSGPFRSFAGSLRTGMSRISTLPTPGPAARPGMRSICPAVAIMSPR